MRTIDEVSLLRVFLRNTIKEGVFKRLMAKAKTITMDLTGLHSCYISAAANGWAASCLIVVKDSNGDTVLSGSNTSSSSVGWNDTSKNVTIPSNIGNYNLSNCTVTLSGNCRPNGSLIAEFGCYDSPIIPSTNLVTVISKK